MLKLAVYDFDGVLANTIWTGYASHRRICRSFNIHFAWSDHSGDDFQDWRNWVSGNWRDNLERLGLMDRVEEAMEIYGSVADDRGIPSLVKGMDRTVAGLENCLQVILTLNMRKRVLPFLEKHGLMSKITATYGAGDLSFDKPNPGALTEVMKDYGVSPEDTVYVGDTLEDVWFANEAGVVSIGMEGGYNPEERIRQGSPRYFVRNSHELLELLRRIKKEKKKV